LEGKDTKYTLLKTSGNEEKMWRKKLVFSKYFEYKGKSDFYEIKKTVVNNVINLRFFVAMALRHSAAHGLIILEVF
jgi:hypothetical protein